MKHKLLLPVLLCLFSAKLFSQNIIAYEYWFDSDYANKVFQTVSSPQQIVTINEVISASSVTVGFHSLQFRSKDDSGRWSAVLTSYIQKLPDIASQQITGYEYWVDDSTQNAVEVSVTQSSIVTVIDALDLSSVATGFHSLNIRFHQTDGKWSSVLTHYFQVLPATNSSQITSYEYWLDNSSNVTSVSVNPESIVQIIDALNFDTVAVGFHSLHSRYKQSDGKWSSALTSYFQKLPESGEENLITAYRYWTDDADSLLKVVQLPSPAPTLSELITANLLDVSTGSKNFHLQFQDKNGKWSSALSDSIVNTANPHLDAIVPNQGGNTGTVTATLYGGFFEGTEVMLVNLSGDTIRAADSLINIVGGTDHFSASFDLLNKPLGFYDVVVTIGSDTVMKLINGFEIVAGIPADVYASVVGFKSIPVNVASDFTLVVGNKGNVDARGVLVGFAVSDTNVIVEPQFSFYPPEDTIPALYITDTLLDELKWYKVFYLIVPVISPNSSQALNFSLRSSTAQPISIKAWAQQPLYDSILSNDKIECLHQSLSSAAENFGFTPPDFGCVYSAIDNFIAPSIANGLANNSGAPEKLISATVNSSTSCITDIIPGAELPVSQQAIKDISKRASIDGSLGVGCTNWWLGLDQEDLIVTVVNSYNPNEKLGPIGAGAENYYGDGNAVPYLIHFENADTATTSIQTALITDSLDKNIFDLNSLQLGFIKVGDTIINLEAGISVYHALIDLRPGKNLVLQIDVNLNDTSGVLAWQFITLDPVTLLPTTDPLLGFLPPNINAPEGEGSVFFTISLKDSLPLGTLIKNDASICFDSTGCLATNEWSNTLDNSLPSSAVDVLPSITYDTAFLVSWSGSDTGSGLDFFNIYASTNGGAYKAWIANTTLSSYLFTGVVDSTYSFYSIAVDSAGNKELAPLAADATTLIGLPTWLSNEDIAQHCHIFPNPTNGKFSISLLNPKKQEIRISLYNTLGNLLREKAFASTGSKQVVEMDLSNETSGLYYLKVRIGNYSVFQKIILEK